MNSYKATKLSAARQAGLRKTLETLVQRPHFKAEQHCQYRLDAQVQGEKIMVKQYNNGTFTLQTQSEAVLNALLGKLGFAVPHPPAAGGDGGVAYFAYGADESGKGDYFGPLVTACVFVPEARVPTLKTLGVTDSKALTDAKILARTPQMVEALGVQNVAFMVLLPASYNAQYEALKARGQHLNHLLSSMHAKTVAGLLAKQSAHNPAFDASAHALMVDQFSQKAYLPEAMREFAPKLRVSQATKAELSHPAVAAASMVARYKFLKSMEALSQGAGCPLPFGASAAVKATARQIYREGGMAALQQVAKLHFKTTLEITGKTAQA